MLESNELILCRTEEWEKNGDVYENFLLNIMYKDDPCLPLIKSKIYAQSWSRKGYQCTDAMWRLYSKKPNPKANNFDKLKNVAIKIHTTVSKLQKIIDAYPEYQTFIDDVNYKNKEEIKKWIADNKNSNNAIKDSQFIKRNAFIHENEVRVLVMDNNATKRKKILRFQINPFDLIEGYCVLDPRLSDEQYKIIKNELESVIKGKYHLKIRPSTLYKLEF